MRIQRLSASISEVILMRNELAAAIEEKYPDVEVEVNDGGQPIYYYVISVE